MSGFGEAAASCCSLSFCFGIAKFPCSANALNLTGTMRATPAHSQIHLEITSRPFQSGMSCREPVRVLRWDAEEPRAGRSRAEPLCSVDGFPLKAAR